MDESKKHFQVTDPRNGVRIDLEVMQITGPRSRQGTADLRVELVAYPQDAAQLNQNELEPEVAALQMRHSNKRHRPTIAGHRVYVQGYQFVLEYMFGFVHFQEAL